MSVQQYGSQTRPATRFAGP